MNIWKRPGTSSLIGYTPYRLPLLLSSSKPLPYNFTLVFKLDDYFIFTPTQLSSPWSPSHYPPQNHCPIISLLFSNWTTFYFHSDVTVISLVTLSPPTPSMTSHPLLTAQCITRKNPSSSLLISSSPPCPKATPYTTITIYISYCTKNC